MRAASVGAQHAEQCPQFGQRAPAGRCDGVERRDGGRRRVGPVRRTPHAGTGLGLDDDHAHVVGDDVVQLAGEMGPLGELGGAQFPFVVLFDSSGARPASSASKAVRFRCWLPSNGANTSTTTAHPSVGRVGVTRQQRGRASPRRR